MTRNLKEFVEKNVKIIDDNNWRQLFINAYDEVLMTAEVQDLHNMLLHAGIIDSTQLRNDLLFEYLKENIDFVRDKYKYNAADISNMSVADSYAVQFLRRYLNNTFGFYEGQALDFMFENQKLLGVELTPINRLPGQGGINNYRIHYDGLS